MVVENLVRQAQGGDQKAFQEICERFTPLVKKMAFQPHVRPIYEEAISAGYMAVVEAVQAFDSNKNDNFAGFVMSKVKFAVWNLFKRERNRWQHEFTLESECGEDMVLRDTLLSEVCIEKQVELALLSRELLRMMEQLPVKQRQAILYTLIGGKNLRETGEILGVSAQAVYSLRQRGVAKLQGRLKQNFMGNKDFSA